MRTKRRGAKIRAILLLFGLCLTPGIRAQFHPDGKELVRKADAKMRGSTNYNEMTMTVVRPDWSRSVRMKGWAKGRTFSLVIITAPAKEKGQSFLKRGNEMWNWIPAIDRTIKIPPSMMSQSWMGSDFTNDDLLKESSIVEDYAHTIAGEETIDGRECFRIACTPLPNAAVVWSKVLLWIAKHGDIELKAEYCDEDQALVNVEHLTAIKRLGGREIPSRMEMTPVGKPGHKTILEMTTITFDQPIPDDFFSLQNLKRLH